MREAIENDMVPRLLKGRARSTYPKKEQQEADPFHSRFLLFFDREDYSSSFFRRMW